MKRAVYSLDDEEFATFLVRLDSSLRSNNISYMIVGGIASQMHIAHTLTEKYRSSLQDIINSETIRIQDYFRATDDVDIVLDTRNFGDNHSELTKTILDTEKLIETKGEISLTGNHLVSIDLARTGLKRPIFRLGLDTSADNPEDSISLNFYVSPNDTSSSWRDDMATFEKHNYFSFFDTLSRVAIPYDSASSLAVNVKSLEALLATKIARDRPKDWSDILGLFRCSTDVREINLQQIQEYLSVPEGEGRLNEVLAGRYTKFLDFISK